MNDMKILGKTSFPGLTFYHGPRVENLSWPRIGDFHADGSGPLFSRAENDRFRLLFEGLLFDTFQRKEMEAERVLADFTAGGLERILDLNGFYNIVLIDKQEGSTRLFGDMASSRPWYVYEGGGVLCLAPSPMVFRDLGLPMTWNRQAMYETVRLLHTGGKRTLVNEVQRMYPGVGLEVRPDGRVERFRFVDWQYRPEAKKGVDSMAAEIKDLVAECVRGVVEHPRLRERSLEISLTGGMDSRHVLGELLEQGHRPERVRHVFINDSERIPVEAICKGLELPLKVVPIADMDHPRLFVRWAERTGGLLNFHQYYLLHMMEDLPPGGVLGFDGYLMDWILGIYPKVNPLAFSDPVDPIWNRVSMMKRTLRFLFTDERKLSRQGREEAAVEARTYEGPHWFRFMMLDFHRRGLHYTGVPYTLMSPDAAYFAPGACPRSLKFFLTSDYSIGGEKRARLRAMQHYFPELSAYPSASGKSYNEYTQLRKAGSSAMHYVKPWPKALASGFRHDPAPQTEHEWLRRSGTLKTLHRRIVTDSTLAADGQWRRRGLAFSWRMHQLGAYEGWALFSMASAEMAYRLLIRGESVESVGDWLFRP